ncbi:MAG: DEAD/DEAH box helicase family protein, partial [Muribaculaceae bacterium]|nr:DEAD/DEAH box helicase family protein [Muribaculaceae bacterium]
GSQAVGGKFDKNDYIFLIEWDYVVIDEAHEGTLTKLGQAVIDEICNQPKKPKILRLSGTPFNLLDQFKEDEIYTWDYVMEQREKREWDKLHLGDNNPYASLPEMQIYTYDLNKLITGYFDEEDNAFNFREFFRTWTGVMEKDFKPIPEGASVGDFIHKDDVNAFLNLLCKADAESNYPF